MKKDIKTIKKWVTFFGVVTIVGIVATVLNLTLGLGVGFGIIGVGIGIGIGAISKFSQRNRLTQ